jgi:hypothetical protein
MHGTVMYDAHRLREIGGFDESLRSCEDWDVYLRLSRCWPVAAYREISADYRRHRATMTRNPIRMLEGIRRVFNRHGRSPGLTVDQKNAARAGMKYMTDVYAEVALQEALHALRKGDVVRTCGVAAKTTWYDPAFSVRLAWAVMRSLRASGTGAGQRPVW